VKKGTRTVVSRNNFRRTYRGALAKLTRPATAGLRPTAARVLKALHDHERGKRLPQGRGQLRDPPHISQRPPESADRGGAWGIGKAIWCLAGGPARWGPWWNAAAAMWGCSRCLRGSPPSACARH
jgi:hypothetical protein